MKLEIEIDTDGWVNWVIKDTKQWEGMAYSGNDPIDVSPDKNEELNRQLETQLKPVLQKHDYEIFDLDQAFQMVAKITAKL